MGARFVAYVLPYSEILYFFEIRCHSLATAFLRRKMSHFEKLKNLNSIGVRDGVGGQGQYRLGRGSIGWARAVSAVPLPKSDFQHIKKVF